MRARIRMGHSFELRGERFEFVRSIVGWVWTPGAPGRGYRFQRTGKRWVLSEIRGQGAGWREYHPTLRAALTRAVRHELGRLRKSGAGIDLDLASIVQDLDPRREP